MFYCPCLDECGELCDHCFNGFTQRYKLVELGPDGRPIFDDPAVPARDVLSDEEMEDLELESGSGEELDFQHPELTRSTASVSRNFRGDQFDEGGPGGEAPRPPEAADVTRVRNDYVRDAYGDYLRRQKIGKK